MVMGDVVVFTVRVGLGDFGAVGVERWVRSKPVEEECSQKLDLEPTMALRWGIEGDGSFMVLEGGVGVLRRVVGRLEMSAVVADRVLSLAIFIFRGSGFE